MWAERFPIRQKEIHDENFIGHASQGDIDGAITDHKTALEEAFSNDTIIKTFLDLVSLDELIALAVMAMHKQSVTSLDDTGLVIAGFGEKEYFPSIHTYNCYGMVLGKLIYEKEEERSISQENVSEVVPLAQSDMAKSFTNGLSPSISALIDREVERALESFDKALSDDGIIPANTDTGAHQSLVKDEFSQRIRRNLDRSHTFPMKRVVGMLPVDELAELAEIFVKMESLKERVTRGTEEVSGPIDVAVITKGDGFVWIKRKHYFEPRLNPGYFSRKGAMHHD